VPTRVIESGRFVSASQQGQHRPVPLGVSIGQDRGQTGTAGFLARRDGELFVVSNNHILALENKGHKGDPILQPGWWDGGRPEDAFAELSDWIDLDFAAGESRLDAAIAVTGEHAVDGRFYAGGIAAGGPAPVKPDRPVWKCGRTTALTHGTVADINASIEVRYESGSILLKQQILIGDGEPNSFAAGGDSGALIVDEDLGQPLALLCAVSPKFTVGNKIELVLEGLGVSFARP
jgi:hypothetical protein